MIELTPRPAEASAGRLIAINVKTLHEDVKLLFDDAIEQRDPGPPTHVMEPDNGHGRLDERTTCAGGEVGGPCKRHPDWQDLRGIVCVALGKFGRRLDFATGKHTTHRRY